MFFSVAICLILVNIAQGLTEQRIKTLHNGKCLDAHLSNKDKEVILYNCHNGNNQKWIYNKITKQIKLVANGKCLDYHVGVNKAIFWDCHNGNNQKWDYNPNTKQLKTLYNGKCLDYHVSIDKAILWDCHNGNNQKWIFEDTVAAPKAGSPLKLRNVVSYHRVWIDKGSGAKKDGAFWKPKLNAGEVFISFVNTLSYSEPSIVSTIIQPPFPVNAVMSPKALHYIWNDKGSGGDQDVYFYRPIPYPGYFCFGDYISRHGTHIASNDYKCIHKSYLEQIKNIGQNLIWDDRGSGADRDGSVWKITTNKESPRQYYLTSNNYNAPNMNNEYYAIKNYILNQKSCLNLNNAQERLNFAKKFAPILKFDRAARGYPMNAQHYLDINNGKGINGPNKKYNNNNINNSPTYFDIVLCNNAEIKIVYWWFYGYQEACFADKGSHPGDWEHTALHLSDCNRVNKVTFNQHGGHYTIHRSRVEFNNNRVVVYIGKVAHGCYYDRNTRTGWSQCGYFNDWRNPKSSKDHLHTANKLIDLKHSNENWIKNKIDICCANPLTKNVCNIGGCDETGCCWYTCGDNWDNRYGSDSKKCINGGACQIFDRARKKELNMKNLKISTSINDLEIENIVIYRKIIIGLVCAFTLICFGIIIVGSIIVYMIKKDSKSKYIQVNTTPITTDA